MMWVANPGEAEHHEWNLMRPRPSLEPELLAAPPMSEDPTDYDYRLLIVYLRLLDAKADGAVWSEAARIVLHLDPERDPIGARAIHAAHLSRAEWMRDHGYHKILADARPRSLPANREIG